MARKAQLSLEYLLLALVALTMLSFAVFALSKTKEAGERRLESEIFLSQVSDIENAAQEICAMGNGNQLAVPLRHTLTMEVSDRKVVFRSNGFEATKLFDCDSDVAGEGNFSGSIIIANKNGVIVFR